VTPPTGRLRVDAGVYPLPDRVDAGVHPNRERVDAGVHTRVDAGVRRVLREWKNRSGRSRKTQGFCILQGKRRRGRPKGGGGEFSPRGDDRRGGGGTRRAEFLRPSTVFGSKFDASLQAARNGHAPRRVNRNWDER
jgi:hypothetical protein